MYNELMIVVCLLALIGTSMFLGFKYGIVRGREATLRVLDDLKIIRIALNNKGDLEIYSGNHFPEEEK